MLKATCDFQSSTLGYVSKDDPIPDNEHGRELLSVGMAVRVQETKTVASAPAEPNGEPATNPEHYGTKVVPNKPGSRKTKKKGKGRGRNNSRSNSASG